MLQMKYKRRMISRCFESLSILPGKAIGRLLGKAICVRKQAGCFR